MPAGFGEDVSVGTAEPAGRADYDEWRGSVRGSAQEVGDARPGRVQLPMLQPLRRPSIIDQAELELRTAIYDGSLRPGDAVPEVAVSRQMGISRSSLREACQRLVRDGLLTQHPGRGLFVTRMDAATMSDFIDYRLGIEMQAATIVAERAAELRAAGRAEAVEQLLAPLLDSL